MGTFRLTRPIRAGTVLSGAFVALALAGCSSSCSNTKESSTSDPPNSEPYVDWGNDSSTRTDAHNDRTVADATNDHVDAPDIAESGPPKPCDPQPLPPDVPEGWEEYPFMECQYRLYVPSSREYLPPPLNWEPCTSNSGPLAYDCRQIRMDWPSVYPYPNALAIDYTASVESDGRVVIQLGKVYTKPGPEQLVAGMGLVVEADGPVRQAIWYN